MVAHLKLPPIRMTHDPNDSDGSESTARNLNKSVGRKFHEFYGVEVKILRDLWLLIY